MLIYLDNCCYNRPYDDQSQLTISLETQAKLYIQNLVKKDKMKLAVSYILVYEISKNPHITNRWNILNYINAYSDKYVSENNKETAEKIAVPIQATGVKRMDALHVACAIIAKADYFLTTDKRLLKYKSEKIKIINPIDFIKEMEESE